jgi:hypothetical protein
MKYLEFLNVDNDLHAFPLNRLVDIRFSSATEVEMFFDGAQPNGGNTKVSLAITSGEVDNVLKSLARVIQSHRGPVVMVADDVNSKYVMSGLTGVNAIEVFEYIAD